jgi:hypothetical protein
MQPNDPKEVVKPLQEKAETVYVVPGSDAESDANRKFANKRSKRVRGTLIPATIDGFVSGVKITFQRHRSEGLDETFHVTFTGEGPRTATIFIRNKTIKVHPGHCGTAQLHVTADSETWLGFLAKERSLLWALLRRQIRVRGPAKLLIAFGKCFPS